LLVGRAPSAYRLHEEDVVEKSNHEARTEAILGGLEADELKSRLQQVSARFVEADVD
jgi:hypothetical protein